MIAAEDGDAIRSHGEEVACRLTILLVDGRRRFSRGHCHRIVFALKPALHMQWLPGAGRLVLGDTRGDTTTLLR
jgi:hypothetical protein